MGPHAYMGVFIHSLQLNQASNACVVDHVLLVRDSSCLGLGLVVPALRCTAAQRPLHTA